VGGDFSLPVASALLDDLMSVPAPRCRRLIRRDAVGDRLHEDGVAFTLAAWIGLPAKQVSRVGGHSIRVGADARFARAEV
jgi:hypothetical protein